MYSVLVFSRTKHGADRICRRLKKRNVEAVAIHSDRTQRQRLAALEGFKRGKYQVMVATDIAARGINIEGISHVVNFDVPGYVEDYIHRIGRTGRAEATGDAMTFVSQEEVVNLRKIEKYIERKLKPEMVDGFSYTHRVNLEAKPKSKKAGKRSRPGSSQRRRMKAQDSKRSNKAKPKSSKQSDRAKPKSAKRSNAKPKSRKKKWSKKSGRGGKG
jgi:ATP-dependent RNA helicase RhlE